MHLFVSVWWSNTFWKNMYMYIYLPMFYVNIWYCVRFSWCPKTFLLLCSGVLSTWQCLFHFRLLRDKVSVPRPGLQLCQGQTVTFLHLHHRSDLLSPGDVWNTNHCHICRKRNHTSVAWSFGTLKGNFSQKWLFSHRLVTLLQASRSHWSFFQWWEFEKITQKCSW